MVCVPVFLFQRPFSLAHGASNRYNTKWYAQQRGEERLNSTKRVMLFVLLIAAVAMIARFWDVLMLFLAAGIIA